MRTGRAVILTTLMVAALSTAAAAQQSVPATLVTHAEVPLSSPWLVTLRQHYARGDTAQLVKAAKELLADLKIHAIDPSCCDYEDHYYEVAFTAFDAGGTETLVRLLIHDPDPQQALVPGLEGDDNPLYIVFIAEDESVQYRATYDLEREENPLLKETGDFAALVLGKFALPTAAAMTNVRPPSGPAAAASPVHPGFVTLLKVVFPYGRAKLTGRHVVEIVDPAKHVTSQASEITAALPTLNPKELPECLRLAGDLNTAIATTVMASCTYSQFETTACWTAIKEKVTGAYEAAMKRPNACPGPDAFRMGRRYALFTTAPPRQLATTAAMSNTPLRWASFSLATTVISGINPDANEPRAKVSSSGLIVPDTFSRFLPLGVFNVMPWKYDSKAIVPTWREQLRFSAGVALTPYLGVSLGGGWNFSRYLGLTVARARIWYDTPKKTQTLNTAPADPDKIVPMRLGSTDVWVWGLTYAVR